MTGPNQRYSPMSALPNSLTPQSSDFFASAMTNLASTTSVKSVIVAGRLAAWPELMPFCRNGCAGDIPSIVGGWNFHPLDNPQNR